MIRFDEAIDIIRSAARPLGTEEVALDQAAGRVLARPIIAGIDSPRTDVSAMDGYAVRNADLASPVELKVVGESFPGSGWTGTIKSLECVRIFTGAPIPGGADRVVIQERVRRDGNAVIVESDIGLNNWIRARGKDFAAGDEILSAGRVLDPGALIAAAGADAAMVEVFAKPRIAMLSNGDELVEPGSARATRLGVPDSASLGVSALAQQWGASVLDRSRLPDDLATMRREGQRVLTSTDLAVVIGGASVGARDFAKSMFDRAGLELLFDRISMRPGKPAWLARANGKLVLGLPGNPTSALVTARLLLAPLLSALQGRSCESALNWESARLRMHLPPCDARETFHRAVLAEGEVSLVGFQESHAQKSLADADLLVRQPASTRAYSPGEPVAVLRL